MSAKHFHTSAAKARVTAEVKAIEAQTSAEVVVVLRGASDPTPEVGLIAGAGLALLALVLLISLPTAFGDAAFVIDVALAFGLGLFLSRGFPTLRRALVPASRRQSRVRRAAAEAFLAHGIHRTHRRQGLLVYASLAERQVTLVLDAGLAPGAPGSAFAAAATALEGSLSRGLDLDRFCAALAALGPALAKTCPAKAGQENELPDELDDA